MKAQCLYWVVAAALVPLPSSLGAQQQSAIVRGLVAGADGQPVADATVTLLDQLGSAVAATRTAANGRFRLEGVPPGTYTVFAEAPPQRSDARIVSVRGALPVDVELMLAARIGESVIVRGTTEAPPVTTRMTISGDALRQLPTRLPSRAVQQMLATLPGWASEDNGLLHVRGVDDGFLYVEDGVPVYDRVDTLFGIAPDPVSIGSINVLTGYIPPQYGLKSGAVIEVQSSTASRTAWTANVDIGLASDAQRSVRALGGGAAGSRARLLLSSSAAARALSPFADDDDPEDTGGAAVQPERQTAWEIGVDQWFGGAVRLDAAYWSRHVRDYADPNVLFGTTIIFPNSVAKGTARGLDLRLEIPRYRGWSSYLSYTLSKVEQIGPINGGLFLEENFLEIGPGTRFTPDHDQRRVSAAGLTYQSVTRGISTSVAMRYQSGTPIEVEEDDLADLTERPGAGLVDFDAGRVRPHTVFDFTASQMLRRGRAETSVRVSILNLTNRAYALNFGNPFSGTHFGAPRTIRVDLRVGLR